MKKDYTIRKHAKRRLTVQVVLNEENWGDIINYQAWVDGVLNEITVWCESNECGRRTSWNMFTFRSRKEMTLFMLRWN